MGTTTARRLEKNQLRTAEIRRELAEATDSQQRLGSLVEERDSLATAMNGAQSVAAVAGIGGAVLVGLFLFSRDGGWGLGSFLCFALAYASVFFFTGVVRWGDEESLQPYCLASIGVTVVCQIGSAFSDPFLILMWTAIVLSLAIAGLPPLLADGGKLAELEREIEAHQFSHRRTKKLQQQLRRLESQYAELSQIEAHEQAEESRRIRREKELRLQAEREQAKAQDKAKKQEVANESLQIREQRYRFMEKWKAHRGDWRDRLHILAELPDAADISVFQTLVLKRSKQQYWRSLGIEPAFGESRLPADSLSRLKLELGIVFSAAEDTLGERYSLEHFQWDLEQVLDGTPANLAHLPCDPVPAYTIIVPEHEDPQIRQSEVLQQCSYRLPLHFAELLVALGVHEQIYQNYVSVHQRHPKFVDAILPRSDFDRLAADILVDWRSPMTAALRINELLSRAEDMMPQEPTVDPRELESLQRRRREVIETLRLHFYGYEDDLRDEFSIDDLNTYIDTELHEDLTLGELQVRVDAMAAVLDNRVARQDVRDYYEHHEEMLERYFRPEDFEAEISAVSLDLTKTVFAAEMSQLKQRIARHISALEGRYSRELAEDRQRREREHGDAEYQQEYESARQQIQSMLERRRSPADSDEDIEHQLAMHMERWQAENPNPVAE